MTDPVPRSFDISLGLEKTHVLITGGLGLIGQHIVQAFLAAGSNISIIDLAPEAPSTFAHDRINYIQADISASPSLTDAFASAHAEFGTVEICIALASLDLSVLTPSATGICDADEEQWRRVIDVNVTGSFLTCREWLRGIRAHTQKPSNDTSELQNPSLIIMGSESGRFGVRSMPAYAAGKSAVQNGLMLSLAQDAPKIHPRARVNAVAPGAVRTSRFEAECERYGRAWEWGEAEATVGLGRAVEVEEVARTCLFLASGRWSGGVHGQVIPVDGGKGGSLCWTREESEARKGREGV